MDNNERNQKFHTKQSSLKGGGVKKVVYALQTMQRIGLKQSTKALRANNTCKACGLGMGGQKGGMVNEQGEFPSVCNKSIQAQSTDIQPPIPKEIFDFTLDDFKELSGREIESLGRLASPIIKAANSDKFENISWEDAIAYAADSLDVGDPDRRFFYCSGRSSNEAGFMLQLFARSLGTANINNCSYYCHQASSVGLASTIGSGTATVELNDLDLCDTIFVIGANPASNHPRFIHKLKACRDRGGEVIVVNPVKEPGLVKFSLPKSPRSLFSDGSEIASAYVQLKTGSDAIFFDALAKCIVEMSSESVDFIDHFTDGYQAYRERLSALTWQQIENSTSLSKQAIVRIAELYSASNNTVFAWGMGITHHRSGVENVEAIANVALLRGMIGRPAAGLLPLRGHSNVQGIGSIGVKPVLADDVMQRMVQFFDLPDSKDARAMDTLACLKAADNHEIDVAMIVGGNLYQATPNTDWAAKAIDKISNKVFLTTTLNLGHVNGHDSSSVLILPVLVRDEELQSTTQESMFNYVRLSDGGINRLDGPRSEVDIICSVAKLMQNTGVLKSNMDFSAFENHQTIREAIAEVLPEYSQIEDIGIAKQEFYVKNRLMHKPDFNTQSGKARFVVSSNSQHAQPPSVVPANDNFPFLLMTVRSEGQFNSIIYEEIDSYRGSEHRNVIFVSPIDAVKNGWKQGDRADVVSATGRLSNLELQIFDIAEGCVMGYYPECNRLVSVAVDERSQTPAFKSVPISLRVFSS